MHGKCLNTQENTIIGCSMWPIKTKCKQIKYIKKVFVIKSKSTIKQVIKKHAYEAKLQF